MPKMPVLGERPKKSPWGTVLLIAVVAGISAGITWWMAQPAPAPAPPPPPSVPSTPTAAQPSAFAPTAAVSQPADGGTPPRATTSEPPEEVLKKAGLRAVVLEIDGPLETALVGAVGTELGRMLAQVVTRALVWWVAVPGEIRKGDKLEVLFEERATEEPVVHAVRFTSLKNGRSFRAYRYKPQGQSFARLFQDSADELELALKGSPLESYEQVTSLIKDGRKHKGVDFKTPVGTEVRATFDGTILRKNWNFRGNGNSLEIVESGGAHRHAIFLHLSELPKTVKVGDHVTRGQVIAASGNTGRSFAPHLHYQLMTPAEKVIDPFESHETFRRKLSENERADFEKERARLDGLLDSESARR